MENETNVPAQLGLAFCINILKGMGLNMTTKEIKMPNSETLNIIYKSFLSNCLSIPQDTYEKDHLVDAIMNFGEDVIKMQTESFKQMQFYILVKQFFLMCGLSPSYMDIFHPLKGRFPKLLSGMIRFCQFQFVELGDDLRKVIEDSKHYMRRCSEVDKEIEDISTKCYQINSENMKNKPLLDQCKKRVIALRDQNAELNEELKRMQEKEDAEIQTEAALEAEEKELLERQETLRKKLTLFDKLIIKSPERLNNEIDKNEARIKELKRLEGQVKNEVNEEKRNLFERENFIESSKSINEVLENHFLTHVQSANLKKNEIEGVREEITNLNFVCAQKSSTVESLKKNLEKLVQDNDCYSKAFDHEMIQFKDREEQLNKQSGELIARIQAQEAKKVETADKINEVTLQTNEMMNNALEKIQMFQKNEEFCKTVAAAKFKTINSLNEASNHKVEQAMLRIKNELEAFKRYDKEARKY